MDNAQMWALIVGAFLPGVLAVVQQSHWSNPTRSVVAFVACVVAGLGTTYFAGALHFGADNQLISTNVLIVLTTALATYHGMWKTSGIAPAIEAKTNLPHIGIIPDVPPTPPAAPAA